MPTTIYRPLSPGVTSLELGGTVTYHPQWLNEPCARALELEIETTARFTQEYARTPGGMRLQPRETAWLEQGFTASSGYRRREPAPAAGPFMRALLLRMRDDFGLHSNAVLINRYRDGADSVTWHADDEPTLASSTIVSLTLGAGRRFMIKPKDAGSSDERLDVVLGDRDLLVMAGTMQESYLHCVTKQPTAPVGPRLNVTLRRYR